METQAPPNAQQESNGASSPSLDDVLRLLTLAYAPIVFIFAVGSVVAVYRRRNVFPFTGRSISLVIAHTVRYDE